MDDPGLPDLETLCENPDRGDELVPAIVDYKIKTTLHSQAKADHDPRAGLYLAGRWLAGQPAEQFCFAQSGKPGKNRKTMSSAFVVTRRTNGQLRGTLARIAQAASQIAALYERYGPTSRGASPTRAAGSAALATAPTTRAAREAAGYEAAKPRRNASCRCAPRRGSVDGITGVGCAGARAEPPRGKEAS